MLGNLLVFTDGGVCLVKADVDSWEKYGMSIYKTEHFEEVLSKYRLKKHTHAPQSNRGLRRL